MPGIVQYHRQLIGVQPVAAANHEIADIPAQVLVELALHPVDEVIIQFRHANTNGGVFRAVSGIAAQPRINAVVRLQLFARAGAGVGQTLAEQAIEHFGIGLVAVALADHLTIPLETVALQSLEDRRLGAGLFAGRVEVFHAHQPAATHRAGVEVGGQCGDQRTEMQVATGRGGKTPDIGGGGDGGHECI
ncbi:hypothetical protein D3C84_851270 [compost metagenome]